MKYASRCRSTALTGASPSSPERSSERRQRIPPRTLDQGPIPALTPGLRKYDGRFEHGVERMTPVPYQVTVDERPTYVYAKAVGELTAANVVRFLEEAYAACVKSGRSDLLLDMQLTGQSLSTTNIYNVMSQRVRDGLKLRKIAYVDSTTAVDPGMAHFAGNVAVNRGVKVHLFHTVPLAEEWLMREPDW